MGITAAGRNYLVARAISTGSQALFSNANSYLGVGNSSAAFVGSQTNLQAASTNRFRKAMEATFPSASSNQLTFKSSYSTSQANFAWKEWGVFNAATSASGIMLNRKTDTGLGTKASGTWNLTVTITIATT